MMGAKKESEDISEKPTTQKTPTEKETLQKKDQKSEPDIFGGKKATGSSGLIGAGLLSTLPEDALKKKVEPSLRQVVAQDLEDGNLNLLRL